MKTQKGANSNEVGKIKKVKMMDEMGGKASGKASGKARRGNATQGGKAEEGQWERGGRLKREEGRSEQGAGGKMGREPANRGEVVVVKVLAG